jgi:DNA-directed RNA polymerase specialized sigma24 family protein
VGLADVAKPSDAVLWQEAASGRRESFGLLFDRHAGAVYTYLFRRTADWSVAEDLTAAVFLQAWRRRSQVTFDGDSALPWLLGVARLLLRNSVRARVRYRAALSRAGAEPVTARLVSATPRILSRAASTASGRWSRYGAPSRACRARSGKP